MRGGGRAEHGSEAHPLRSLTYVCRLPHARRQEMSQAAGGNEMESVKNYFNKDGFERWNKIYGTTSEVNKVQLDIRTGHAQTVDKVLGWLQDEGGVKGISICDVRLPPARVFAVCATPDTFLCRLAAAPAAWPSRWPWLARRCTPPTSLAPWRVRRRRGTRLQLPPLGPQPRQWPRFSQPPTWRA